MRCVRLLEGGGLFAGQVNRKRGYCVFKMMWLCGAHDGRSNHRLAQ